jgi:hypothetical protein
VEGAAGVVIPHLAIRVANERAMTTYTQDLLVAIRRLEELSRTDVLASVANRRRFDEYLSDAWAHAKMSGEPMALPMINIDHFKSKRSFGGLPPGPSQPSGCVSHSVAGVLHQNAIDGCMKLLRNGPTSTVFGVGGKLGSQSARRCAASSGKILTCDCPLARMSTRIGA